MKGEEGEEEGKQKNIRGGVVYRYMYCLLYSLFASLSHSPMDFCGSSFPHGCEWGEELLCSLQSTYDKCKYVYLLNN